MAKGENELKSYLILNFNSITDLFTFFNIVHGSAINKFINLSLSNVKTSYEIILTVLA